MTDDMMMRVLAFLSALLMLGACMSDRHRDALQPDRSAATGQVCAGIAGIQCSQNGDYCALPVGSCRMADSTGTCTARPQICTQVYRPVCGCDGKTYGNACTAASAGVSVDAQGACPQ